MNDLLFRLAKKEDLEQIVKLLAADDLGSTRENSQSVNLDKYAEAFTIIQNDPNQELTVVEMSNQLVATFQLSFIQYLTYTGGKRCQVEAVRVSSAYRGQGLGKKVFEYISNRAKTNGCHLVQLTSDKKRVDAIRFYESIGFTSSHEGMKLHLK